MLHDRLRPILDAYCYANDYGKDSRDKADSLSKDIVPLGASVDKKTTLIALYAIINTSIQLVNELEGIDIQEKVKEIEHD